MPTHVCTFAPFAQPLFSAPEVLKNDRYGPPVDVWSFGCILSCMYTRAGPYPHVPSDTVRRVVMEGDLRPHTCTACPFSELIDWCGGPSDERPSFAVLLGMLEGPVVQQRAAAAGASQPLAEVVTDEERNASPQPTAPGEAARPEHGSSGSQSNSAISIYSDKERAAPSLFEDSFPTPGLLQRTSEKVQVRFSRFSLRTLSTRLSARRSSQASEHACEVEGSRHTSACSGEASAIDDSEVSRNLTPSRGVARRLTVVL